MRKPAYMPLALARKDPKQRRPATDLRNTAPETANFCPLPVKINFSGIFPDVYNICFIFYDKIITYS